MGYFKSLYAAELPHRDVAVYMYLKHRANAEGRCWPSVRTIAKDLSLSRATVQRALRELQQDGWIAAEPRWRENGVRTPGPGGRHDEAPRSYHRKFLRLVQGKTDQHL